jgi:membrane protein implicated in regulation of membrane protease activity
MADSTLWWLLAGGAVGIELLTGTFYLLMLAIGLAAAALVAHAGASLPVQVVVAALASVATVGGWHFLRKRGGTSAPGTNLDFDAGEQVHVDAWTADNTTTVRYRGTTWTAVPAAGTPEGSGTYRVRHVDGSRLVIEKI